MSKPWYKSKTMWANALIAAGGVVLDAMHNAGGYLATAAALINMALRTVTREPLGADRENDQAQM